ncbi:phosphonate C-P lyase system protein PhnH [Rhodovulum sulfidophilum]|uniref:Phosphonate C-P lyase system protein PhnH n=1 Tax=Rhodovulum visakhapatnamense TaxID=364297 RepID=A0ABS1RKZ8_9RHOB|nr:phosphonate C-P lyase system protein PhnH [Rhodovulum visakhapatnamense]MBL3569709.1 phosphonate C-P lyase system protein PhnH [Rhodovulum visakhapatnamense]MBL3580190.1 phosphonate C-P lyase system protein PhnH [Rhodovulum visakhapatnamense]OLS44583.1 phosphonate C-P lyase system protein PhnH [Rhodovulum sulfidophilum]
MDVQALSGGFADTPREAALAFRAALTAMARPGRIEDVAGARPPAPLSVAAGTLLLVLADPTTPVHLAGSLDRPEIRDWLRFHTGAPLSDRAGAVFAVGRWADLLPLDAYSLGTPDYPDRSATLIVEMDALDATGARLTGPGIETSHGLSLPEIAAFRANRARFPLGLDFFFTAGARLAALPRSTHVEAV